MGIHNDANLIKVVKNPLYKYNYKSVRVGNKYSRGLNVINYANRSVIVAHTVML